MCENKQVHVRIGVDPQDLGKILGEPLFGCNWMEASPAADALGTIPQFVDISRITKLIESILGDPFYSCRACQLENTQAVLEYLANLRNIPIILSQKKCTSNGDSEQIKNLTTEVARLNKKIETLKAKDYKNRALKASMTRANKIINKLIV